MLKRDKSIIVEEFAKIKGLPRKFEAVPGMKLLFRALYGGVELGNVQNVHIAVAGEVGLA